MTASNALIQVEHWLDQVVIGLNLCPFASKPRRQNQIHIDLFSGDLEQLVPHLVQALTELDAMSPAQRETTIIVLENVLEDFDEYNDFLDQAQWVIEQSGWEGTYQIASFHPDYQFADTQPQDRENLTNRSPFPILHLIREASLEEVLAKYPNPESIPDNNIKRMESLSENDIATLFPYLLHNRHSQ